MLNVIACGVCIIFAILSANEGNFDMMALQIGLAVINLLFSIAWICSKVKK